MMRFFRGLLAVVLLPALLAGCGTPDRQQAGGKQEEIPTAEAGYEEGVTVRVAALKGPTAMGLVKLMKDNEAENAAHYQFDLYTSADEITALLGKGEVDAALVPSNLAATLYQRMEGGVQVLDVNAGNVLYVMSHDETLNSIEGLREKTVYMTGKGTTPEWTLRYLLEQNGMSSEDLTVEFKTESNEVLAFLAQDENAVAVLPQPFATVAMMQDQELSMNFPLDNAWRAASEKELGIVTGVTVVRTAFAREHPAATAQFAADHLASMEYVTGHPAESAQWIEECGIVKAPVAQQVLENFNPISGAAGEQMKEWVADYLSMLFTVSPDAVGGTLPDEGFYYLG